MIDDPIKTVVVNFSKWKDEEYPCKSFNKYGKHNSSEWFTIDELYDKYILSEHESTVKSLSDQLHKHDSSGQSELLVLFAEWLQYNGKWDSPETQVKNFLKEQKQISTKKRIDYFTCGKNELDRIDEGLQNRKIDADAIISIIDSGSFLTILYRYVKIKDYGNYN